MPDDPKTWTTRMLLAWTTRHFEQHGLDAPRVQAEMLLGHVLGCNRLRLYMEPDRPADPGERDRFRALVQRAADHEPVDYLVGYAPFFALEFAVSPAVLIPRPSTETLVEHVLQDARQRGLYTPPASTKILETPDAPETSSGSPETADTPPLPESPPQSPPQPSDAPASASPSEAAGEVALLPPLRIADIGTGSGAIIISVLKHLPHATGVAVDLSPEALAVAQQNADAHGVADRIDFRIGDLLGPLGGERFDYLLSNPPYIPDSEWAQVAANVKDHEPVLALRGGADGLDLLRPLIAGVPRLMTEHGRAAFEIAAVQKDAVLRLAAEAGWRDAAVLDDHESLPRVLVGAAGGA